ncbi:MAG: secretin N-terminal domain-containing protein, partial [Candidatus Methanoperedens sp.]|nr:secretin N-terminal domain-containing protein [Candidatus Methanoperedens sp.]
IPLSVRGRERRAGIPLSVRGRERIFGIPLSVRGRERIPGIPLPLWEGLGVGCCYFILAAIFLINPLNVYCAQEDQPGLPETASDKISLDLKNVDIVELLRIISLKTGKTIVPSKEVAGRITVYLSNVAFNDVLDIILLTQGLALNRKGNVYYVMSETEYRKIFGRGYVDPRKIQTVKLTYAKPSVIFTALGQLKSDVGKIVVDESSGTIILIDIPEKLELLNKTIQDLDRPLTTTVYDLNYIKAADAKTQLSAAITPGTGEVIIDERSQKAIISDLPQKMQRMNMVVRELDEQSRQVYVEADIVELTLSDKFERGIDWEKVYSAAAMDGLTVAGYFPAAYSLAANPVTQKISVGTLAANKYEGILNFLNTYGKTNIISQPRIAVVNNEEANVMVGVREAYITQTQSQATSTLVTSESVEFIDVGVKLKIVPRIGADGFITMKLKPEVSSVKETITTAIGSRIPIVQTAQSETVVKIKDGSMIMIAGMTRVEDTEAIKGWPVLAKIPILGIFFSNRTHEKKRTEVIIFLTPHLSSGDAGLRGAEISKIVPLEHLPENLQAKVSRDQKIDNTLINVIQGLEENPDQEKELKNPEAKLVNPAAPPVVVEKIPRAPLKETAKDYYKKGLRAQAGSDVEEAIRNFNKAAQLDHKYAAAYNSLGIIYEQELKFKKAEAMYLKAITADPNFSPAYANLALFNEDQNDFVKALEYWRKRVFYGNPDDAWTKQALQRIKELEQ